MIGAKGKWVGALMPDRIMDLIGKKVVQVNYKTKEKWKPLTLIKVEITKEGVFAILHEDYNIRLNMMEYAIYEEEVSDDF